MSVKNSKINGLFENSFFISVFGRLAAFLHKSFKESVIGSFMCSYDAVNDISKKGIISGPVTGSSSSPGFMKKIRQLMLWGIEKSSILNVFKGLVSRLLHCSLKIYGVFLFSSGLYTGLIYFLSKYAFHGYEKGTEYLICGVLMLICAVPMMFTSRSLSATLGESFIMSRILFGLFGIRRENTEETETQPGGRGYVAFILGIAFGLLSLVISPVYIIAAVIGTAAAAAVLESPEVGVVAMFIMLPFSGTVPLALITLFVSLSFFLKLIQGKRTLKIRIIDLLAAMFMIYLLFGGIVSVNTQASLRPALVYICFMLGYFLVVNTIKTGEWVNRCVAAVAIGSVIVSLYGIYENFFGKISSVWLDEEMFENISGRVVSTFSNPNVLAEYLVMTIPFLFALAITSKTNAGRFFSLLAAGAGCLCLVYTWSRGAWLGFVFAALVFLLLWSRRSLAVLCVGLFAVPFIPFVLPKNILGRIQSIGNLGDTSTAYRVNIWKGVVKLLGDHALGGIGIGEGAFSSVYSQYTLSGIERAPHSHNLFLQIATEIGIPGLLLFIALIIVFAQSCFSFYSNDCAERDPSAFRAKMISVAGFCGIIAVLVQGLTDYVWYNYRIFFIFWLIMGLVVAVRRSRIFEKPSRPDLGISIEIPLGKQKS